MSKTQKLKQVFLASVKNAADLDETITDYICGLLEDDSLVQNRDELDGVLLPYLVDTQCVATEDEAKEVIEKLLGNMAIDGVGASPKVQNGHSNGKPNDLKLLQTSIKLANKIDDFATAEEKATDWMKPEERKTYVNQQNLEALDAKREKKKEKKQKIDEFKRQQKNLPVAPANVQSIHAEPGAASKPRDIRLETFSISYGKDWLIEDADLMLAFGRRYGFVGRNGTGKSTLLRHLAGREIHGIPAHIRILHVEQEIEGDDTTVLRALLACDVERDKLLADEQATLQQLQETPSAEFTDRLQKIHTRLQEIDAHTAEARASSILAGLGFEGEMQQRATKEYSGGWRMRISLGRALFSKPDLLLLDEPTNHLDLYSTLWLEEYLQKWEGTIFVVSHHRQFLSAVSTDIIHLQGKKLEHYKGNYDMFEQVKDERMRQQQRAFDSQQSKRKHIQAFIDRFRYNANRAALVQSRLKALERMEVIDAVSQDPTVILQLTDPDTIAPPILQFRDVTFGYPQKKPLFTNLNLGIDMESRVALVGANGAGKSTLLSLMAGDMEPSSGTVLRNPKLRFARFSQHFVDQLDLGMSCVDHFMTTYPGVPLQTVRSHLGSFGLSGEIALRTINTLSGGQKSRLVLATLSWRKPHVLLLDEPTNHLDIETIDALSNALLTYKGGVLLVSHDERLITLVCDQIWYLHNNTVTVFDGDFEAYKKLLLKEMAETNAIKI